MNILKNLGKREALVYLSIFLWIGMAILGVFNDVDFVDLAIYFGSLTAYVATYIWSETTRPSDKTGILKKGPTSRREAMIYIVILLWIAAGVLGIIKGINIESLGIYFVSLTGFVGSWIAGERYKPEDHIIKKKDDFENYSYEEDPYEEYNDNIE